MKSMIFLSFSTAFLCCTLLTTDAYANNWKTKSMRKIGRSGPSVSKYKIPGQRLKHTILKKNFAPRIPRAKMAFGSTNTYGSPISWPHSISKNNLRKHNRIKIGKNYQNSIIHKNNLYINTKNSILKY